MVAGTTLVDPWRVINHCFCDSGSATKPHHSGHMQTWGSPPGPHSGVTPEVGQGTLAQLKAASSGEILTIEGSHMAGHMAAGHALV